MAYVQAIGGTGNHNQTMALRCVQTHSATKPPQLRVPLK
jgi:hypothetical protein